MRTHDALASNRSPLSSLRLRRAKAWAAMLVAAVSAFAVPMAQARAASCERAAALVSATSVDAQAEADARSSAEAPAEIAEPSCPSVVAALAAPRSMSAAPVRRSAARARPERAPPLLSPPGLERPPRPA